MGFLIPLVITVLQKDALKIAENLHPSPPSSDRTSVAAFERGEAREDGNRPGDAEAGGPPTSPPAAGQGRGPQPAAP